MIPVSAARKFIRFFPKPVERGMRSAIWAMWPVSHRSRYEVLFHCCTWKTASQWIKAILSDPRVYQECGLRAKPAGVKNWPKLTNNDANIIDAGYVYTNTYQPYSKVLPHIDAHDARAFFVLRDPRDLLVSRYFSRLSAHPETEGIVARRGELSDLTKEDGLLHVLEDFNSITEIVDDWLTAAQDDPRVMFVRYEDLTGPNQIDVWEELFRHLDISLSSEKLASVLRYYSFENITGGRKKGIEDKGHKYRKGEAGDWVNHFTPAVSEAMERRYGNLANRWGYE